MLSQLALLTHSDSFSPPLPTVLLILATILMKMRCIKVVQLLQTKSKSRLADVMKQGGDEDLQGPTSIPISRLGWPQSHHSGSVSKMLLAL